MKPSEININKVFGLAVGPPGKGKTIGVTSWPKPIWIADIDNRIKPAIVYHGFKDGEIEIEQFRAKDFEGLISALNRVAGQNKLEFATYIIDGLTFLAKMSILYAMNIRGSDKALDKGIIQMTSITDFGAESRALDKVLTFCRDNFYNKAHFWLTAHYLVTVDKKLEGEPVITRRVVTAGKNIAAELPGYFDEVYFFNTEKQMSVNDPPKYTIKTAGAEDEFWKTALGLPVKLDWTGKKLYDVIEEKRKK